MLHAHMVLGTKPTEYKVRNKNDNDNNSIKNTYV